MLCNSVIYELILGITSVSVLNITYQVILRIILRVWYSYCYSYHFLCRCTVHNIFTIIRSKLWIISAFASKPFLVQIPSCLLDSVFSFLCRALVSIRIPIWCSFLFSDSFSPNGDTNLTKWLRMTFRSNNRQATRKLSLNAMTMSEKSYARVIWQFGMKFWVRSWHLKEQIHSLTLQSSIIHLPTFAHVPAISVQYVRTYVRFQWLRRTDAKSARDVDHCALPYLLTFQRLWPCTVDYRKVFPLNLNCTPLIEVSLAKKTVPLSYSCHTKGNIVVLRVYPSESA